MKADRILVIVAYVLLVGIVIWTSWDANNRIDKVEDLQCQSLQTQFQLQVLIADTQNENGFTEFENQIIDLFSKNIIAQCGEFPALEPMPLESSEEP